MIYILQINTYLEDNMNEVIVNDLKFKDDIQRKNLIESPFRLDLNKNCLATFTKSSIQPKGLAPDFIN